MMALTIASRSASTGYSYTSCLPTPRTVPASRMFLVMACQQPSEPKPGDEEDDDSAQAS